MANARIGAGRREASDSRGLDARMHFNRVHDRESGACIGNLRLSHTDETARRINGQMAWMVFAFGAPSADEQHRTQSFVHRRQQQVGDHGFNGGDGQGGRTDGQQQPAVIVENERQRRKRVEKPAGRPRRIEMKVAQPAESYEADCK